MIFCFLRKKFYENIIMYYNMENFNNDIVLNDKYMFFDDSYILSIIIVVI